MRHQPGRIAGFDALRGVAISLILLRHAWPETFGGAGVVGVTVFFTLSGYFTTATILRSLKTSATFDYREFLRRRAGRLLPPLILMLIVFIVGEIMLGTPGGARGLAVGVAVGALHLQDVLPFFAYPGINHLWVLAIEAKFYFVWPAIMKVVVHRPANRPRRDLWVMTTGALLVCALTAIVATRYFSVDVIYPLPTTWVAPLLLGALWREHIERGLAAKSSGPLSLAAILLLALLSLVPGAKSMPATYVAMIPLVSLLTIVVMNHVQSWRAVPLFALQPLVALGVASYSIYLWNGPATHWTIDIAHWHPSISILLSVLAGALSWLSVERRYARGGHPRSTTEGVRAQL